jgi:hypothetical protein
MLKENNLNLLGLHADTRLETLPVLEDFLSGEEGLALLRECKKNQIDIEFELHVLQDLLPRDLFVEHPDYFRLDENGLRQQEHNMCFTCKEAYAEIEKRISEITAWLKPTTHRYFMWTDDVQDAFCHCEQCSPYSESEQALIFENRLLDILRKIDPLATVAHLAYNNTLEAPEQVEPSKGVFLEYAPISRDYSKALPEAHLNKLEANLKVFPSHTAHILEYWLDASMFSNWDRDLLVQIPWKEEYCRRDVDLYRELGITSITSFGAWLSKDYVEKFGQRHRDEVMGGYGSILNQQE